MVPGTPCSTEPTRSSKGCQWRCRTFFEETSKWASITGGDRGPHLLRGKALRLNDPPWCSVWSRIAHGDLVQMSGTLAAVHAGPQPVQFVARQGFVDPWFPVPGTVQGPLAAWARPRLRRADRPLPAQSSTRSISPARRKLAPRYRQSVGESRSAGASGK